MSKGLLLVVGLGIASFFTWKHYSKPKIFPPEQEIENLIAKGTLSAVELTEVTDKFPALVGRALRDRRITVTGVLHKAMVKGVGSHDLILDLEGSRKRKITFASDVNSYARANNSIGKSKTKFQKFGREIVVYESAPSRASIRDGIRCLKFGARKETRSCRKGRLSRTRHRDFGGNLSAHHQRQHFHRVETIEEPVSSDPSQVTGWVFFFPINQAIPMQIS